MKAIAALVLVAAACRPIGATPATRILPGEAPAGPPRAIADLQIEAGRSSVSDSYGMWVGDARLRRGVTDRVAVEVEGGVLDSGDLPPEHDGRAYHGRVGALISNGDDQRAPHVALMAGVGGGTSRIGNWAGADVGAGVMRRGTFRPYLNIDVYASRPSATTSFEVARGEVGGEGGEPTIDTVALRPTYGGRATFGFEAGDDTTALIIAYSIGRAYVDDPKLDGNRGVGSLGVGIRFVLD